MQLDGEGELLVDLTVDDDEPGYAQHTLDQTFPGGGRPAAAD